MNIQNIRTLLDTVAVPNTARTLGGEKAVRSVGQRSDGIHIALHFGFLSRTSPPPSPMPYKKP